MNKKTIPAFLISFTLAPLANAADLSSTVTFVSDYRYHGISQTAGDPAVQASIDASFDNGIYLGAWGSNVDFGDDANLEVDYYVGYSNELESGIGYNLTALYYTYPGYEAADIDYVEFSSGVSFKGFSVYYNYADDYVNTGESGQYLSLDFTHEIIDNVSFNAHVGHSFGDYWGNIGIKDYEDYSVGVSTSLIGLDIALDWLFNDISDSDESSSGVLRNDDTLTVSVSRTF